MILGIKRRKIEDQIVAQYEAVDWDAKKSAWIESEKFEDFIFAFFDLRKYYEKSKDTTVGLEAIRVYMDGVRALQAAAENRKLSLDRRDAANRLIYELNHQVEAVMYELEQNRQALQRADEKRQDDQDGSGGVPMPI